MRKYWYTPQLMVPSTIEMETGNIMLGTRTRYLNIRQHIMLSKNGNPTKEKPNSLIPWLHQNSSDNLINNHYGKLI